MALDAEVPREQVPGDGTLIRPPRGRASWRGPRGASCRFLPVVSRVMEFDNVRLHPAVRSPWRLGSQAAEAPRQVSFVREVPLLGSQAL